MQAFASILRPTLRPATGLFPRLAIQAAFFHKRNTIPHHVSTDYPIKMSLKVPEAVPTELRSQFHHAMLPPRIAEIVDRLDSEPVTSKVAAFLDNADYLESVDEEDLALVKEFRTLCRDDDENHAAFYAVEYLDEALFGPHISSTGEFTRWDDWELDLGEKWDDVLGRTQEERKPTEAFEELEVGSEHHVSPELDECKAEILGAELHSKTLHERSSGLSEQEAAGFSPSLQSALGDEESVHSSFPHDATHLLTSPTVQAEQFALPNPHLPPGTVSIEIHETSTGTRVTRTTAEGSSRFTFPGVRKEEIRITHRDPEGNLHYVHPETPFECDEEEAEEEGEMVVRLKVKRDETVVLRSASPISIETEGEE